MLYCYHTDIFIINLSARQLRVYRAAVKALPTRRDRRRRAVDGAIFHPDYDGLVYVKRR